ncbi:four helix bundle protein [Alienimonas chondri]|uniref:Four helix bundle protein n=1 Tax=Alienimonas chondri TaxID=2681879 RepID=A0ABX1VBQ8_9PLAN|nr:four helix bundle protein [Alienimonas chondri]NNJ25540.1 hypothetical protein [Alienimonas chondri]
MSQTFDLDDRTERFAREVRQLIRKLPRTLCNSVDAKQLVRSSGSVGANYLEANEALGGKDFRYRIKVSRKEAKESGYWLRLLDCRDIAVLADERDRLEDEAGQLVRIFTAILRNHSAD